eukprot:14493633-Ditylum_brightwellii.AAC.1
MHKTYKQAVSKHKHKQAKWHVPCKPNNQQQQLKAILPDWEVPFLVVAAATKSAAPATTTTTVRP